MLLALASTYKLVYYGLRCPSHAGRMSCRPYCFHDRAGMLGGVARPETFQLDLGGAGLGTTLARTQMRTRRSTRARTGGARTRMRTRGRTRTRARIGTETMTAVAARGGGRASLKPGAAMGSARPWRS